MNLLFVTWDGPQVSYLESLFIPVFDRLSDHGFRFHVLQFGWGSKERIETSQRACANAGVSYRAAKILRQPHALGAMLTAVSGARHVRDCILDHEIDVVMPRSVLPALMTMLALRKTKRPMLFDADGLPLDERVDFSGQSPSSLAHRMLRDAEAQAVIRADVVLTRSAQASQILQMHAGAGVIGDKFFVVTNGRDANLFLPGDASQRTVVRRRLGLAADTPILVYAGSIGPQYCKEEMLRLFELIRERRPDARFLFLTGSGDTLQQTLDKSPHIREHVTTLHVPPQDVPQYLACADLGVAFRRPSFSMRAVAPIKIGEYLLCGLPVLATAGIGDAGEIPAEAGRLLSCMDEVELQSAAEWFVSQVLANREAYRVRSRAIGLNRFSLNASVEMYRQALRRLPRNV